MSFQLIPNLILIISIIGILYLLLRRMPEVVAGKEIFPEAERLEASSAVAAQPALGSGMQAKALWYAKIAAAKCKSRFIVIWNASYAVCSKLVKKLWNFMLEAKDFKQGQILASKFIRSKSGAEALKQAAKEEAKKSKQTFNIGAHSQMKKAERLLQENDLAAAEEVFLEIIKKHPHEYQAYEGLVFIYSKQKEHGEVQELLEYLVKHNPENDGYMIQLANVLMKRRMYEEAAKYYEMSIGVNNLIPERFVNLGLCLAASGNFEKAIEQLKKAVDLDPSEPKYLMVLVEHLVKAGMSEDAVKALQRGAEINPGSEQIKKKLAELAPGQGGPRGS